MDATKTHIIELYSHLPKTKEFVNSVLNFEWVSEEQKMRTWQFVGMMANAERRKIADNAIQAK